jgi:hypothetical protein
VISRYRLEAYATLKTLTPIIPAVRGVRWVKKAEAFAYAFVC